MNGESEEPIQSSLQDLSWELKSSQAIGLGLGLRLRLPLHLRLQSHESSDKLHILFCWLGVLSSIGFVS